jgi:hypothetical protein
MMVCELERMLKEESHDLIWGTILEFAYKDFQDSQDLSLEFPA